MSIFTSVYFVNFLILYLVLVAMCMSECWDAREKREKRDERAEALRESLVRVRGNGEQEKTDQGPEGDLTSHGRHDRHTQGTRAQGGCGGTMRGNREGKSANNFLPGLIHCQISER